MTMIDNEIKRLKTLVHNLETSLSISKATANDYKGLYELSEIELKHLKRKGEIKK